MADSPTTSHEHHSAETVHSGCGPKRPPQRRAAARLFALALLALCEFSLEASASVRLTFSWQDNSENERGFRVERSMDGVIFHTLATVAANTTSYDDDTVEGGRRYWYRVAAFNAGGDSLELPVVDGFAPNVAPSANTPPSISTFSNYSVVQGTSIAPVPFMIGDPETAVDSLTLLGNVSNTDLVPLNSIQFSGTGANRTLSLKPAPNRTGWSTIWVKVSDGTAATVRSFVLVVTESKPGAPTSLTIR